MGINLCNATKQDVISWMEQVTRLAYNDWAMGRVKRTGQEVINETAIGWRSGHVRRASVIYSTAYWTFEKSEDA